MQTKVYVAHAMTNEAPVPSEVHAVIKWLKRCGMEVIHPTPGLFSEGPVEWTLAAIRNASIVVADVSTYSHGVGFELGYAYALDKAVIVMAREERKEMVSRFVRGLFPNLIWYASVEDALQKVAALASEMDFPLEGPGRHSLNQL